MPRTKATQPMRRDLRLSSIDGSGSAPKALQNQITPRTTAGPLQRNIPIAEMVVIQCCIPVVCGRLTTQAQRHNSAIPVCSHRVLGGSAACDYAKYSNPPLPVLLILDSVKFRCFGRL